MIDDSKQASLKKELISYMSIYYDKKNLKEQNKIADDILKVFNEDKKFRDKVEKIAKKINDIKKIKKGGRRNKTRKNKKGGNGDDFLYPIAIIAAAAVIGYGLLQVARAIEGGVEQWRRSNVMAEERERQGENFTSQTTSTSKLLLTPPSTPRGELDAINPGLRSRRGNADILLLLVAIMYLTPKWTYCQFSNRTGQMLARLGQQDELSLELLGLKSFYTS